MYYTLGGTLNYYAQDYWSIFTNIQRPFIKFFFTANTSSFGTNTTIKHQLYKIPYKEFKEYVAQVNRKNVFGGKSESEEVVDETFVENGQTKTTTTKKKIKSNSSIESFVQDSFSKDSKISINSLNNYSSMSLLLSKPILTLTASTSGITENTYYLFLDEYQKNKGDYTFQLFEDYAQYFITTQFEFDRNQSIGLYNFCQLGENKEIVPIDYQYFYKEITPIHYSSITGGTFSGITVCGNYFTYFLIPSKPNWVSPYVEGQLETFTPTFFWANSNDADSYLFQVVYDSGDSRSFSGTVYSYPIKKEDTKLSTNELLGGMSGEWSITQKTTDIVREYSIPIAYEKQFWYRVGGVKEMTNVFGVKQSVVTFSDVMSAITSSGSYETYVYIKSDSPYISDVSDWIYPDYLNDKLNDFYSLSGIVVGSIVTGATVQLISPNGNYITKPTDSAGNFIFEQIGTGLYNINTFYRGYASDTRSINITGNTFVTIDLKLIWGNSIDTFGSMSDKVFGMN